MIARMPRTTPVACDTLSRTRVLDALGRLVDPFDRAGDRIVDALGLVAHAARSIACTSVRIAVDLLPQRRDMTRPRAPRRVA